MSAPIVPSKVRTVFEGRVFTVQVESITLPNGDVKTLLRIDDWDFSWQERYRFADFVSLPKGTRLDAEMSYDNSSANKRNPGRPPVRVTWGEESNDEMGSIGLQVVAASPGELPQLRQAFLAHVRQAALARPGLGQLLRRRQTRQ